MSNFVTSDYVVGVIYGLLTTIVKPKYRLTKPTAATDKEYIVINTLPIPANSMQKVFVNVNYHVKDIAPGVPDIAKLEAGSISIINLLQKVSKESYLIDIESQETIREEALQEHYSNLRFSFKQFNK